MRFEIFVVFPERCHMHPKVKGQIARCTYRYSSAFPPQDGHHYDIGWNNFTGDNIHPQSKLAEAFTVRSAKNLSGLPYWGFLTVYGGGGYVANLGDTKQEAFDMITGLEESDWLDHLTRAVFIETNIYNANSNLFTAVTLLFEYPATGGLFTWHRMVSVNLYRYNGAMGVFALLTELITLIIFVYRCVQVVRNIIKSRTKYLCQFWTVLEIIMLLLLATSMSFYAYRSVETVRSVEYMKNNPGNVLHLPCNK